jgi:hypothetical protein
MPHEARFSAYIIITLVITLKAHSVRGRHRNFQWFKYALDPSLSLAFVFNLLISFSLTFFHLLVVYGYCQYIRYPPDGCLSHREHIMQNATHLMAYRLLPCHSSQLKLSSRKCRMRSINNCRSRVESGFPSCSIRPISF